MAGHIDGVTSHESISDQEMFDQEDDRIPLKLHLSSPARPSALFLILNKQILVP